MANFHSYENRWEFLLTAAFASIFFISCGKRADPAPKPQPPPPFEFLSAWGDKGDGPGKLDEPAAFATDSLGNVFFADPGSSFVHKFTPGGTPLLSFEDTRLRHASGIAVDSGGAIYVADAERGNILIFFPDGTFLRAIHFAPQPHFSGALGFSTDDQGNLYAPDPAGSRVMKFDGRGRLAKSWHVPNGSSKDATSPDERPSMIATAPDGSVFVAYGKTGRVEKYSSDGSWITSWSAAENSAPGTPAITGLALMGQFVFTMSPTPPQIRVWTIDGEHKLDDDLGGRLASIAAPQIATTPHAELLLFDPAAPHVFWFRTHLQPQEQK